MTVKIGRLGIQNLH